MKDIENHNENEEGLSHEILHIYSGFEEEEPVDQFRRRSHNELVKSALKKLDDANSNADKVNIWIPKLQRMALVKKIQQTFFAIFGLAIVFWGISIAPVENGLIIIGLELIGIVLAGIAIFVSSIFAILSWDEDIIRLLVISRSDENLMFAEFSNIQAQLSFIKNEIIDLKKKI
jgi:hypothetical protein